MKFLIVGGHEGTTGAVSGKIVEEVLTEQLSEKIVAVLKSQGQQAIEPDFNLYDQVDNKSFPVYLAGFDYVLEVHFNYFNGQAVGTEIFVAPGITAISVEKAIMARMSKFFKLRDPDGVKNENFKTIKHLQNKGALIEVCFLDSKSDMNVYLNNIDNIAREIAYGLMEGFGLPITVPTTTVKIPPVVTVTTTKVSTSSIPDDMAPEGKLFQVSITAERSRKGAMVSFNIAKAAGLNPSLVLVADPNYKGYLGK